MASLEKTPDWQSLDNHALLNPRISGAEAQSLMDLFSIVEGLFRSHLFILSSGTASTEKKLKWVALSKSAFLLSASAVNDHLESDANDVWIHTLPNFHVGGLGIWARSHLSGARVV